MKCNRWWLRLRRTYERHTTLDPEGNVAKTVYRRRMPRLGRPTVKVPSQQVLGSVGLLLSAALAAALSIAAVSLAAAPLWS